MVWIRVFGGFGGAFHRVCGVWVGLVVVLHA
jgi:hypothetical protein